MTVAKNSYWWLIIQDRHFSEQTGKWNCLLTCLQHSTAWPWILQCSFIFESVLIFLYTLMDHEGLIHIKEIIQIPAPESHTMLHAVHLYVYRCMLMKTALSILLNRYGCTSLNIHFVWVISEHAWSRVSQHTITACYSSVKESCTQYLFSWTDFMGHAWLTIGSAYLKAEPAVTNSAQPAFPLSAGGSRQEGGIHPQSREWANSTCFVHSPIIRANLLEVGLDYEVVWFSITP